MVVITLCWQGFLLLSSLLTYSQSCGNSNEPIKWPCVRNLPSDITWRSAEKYRLFYYLFHNPILISHRIIWFSLCVCVCVCVYVLLLHCVLLYFCPHSNTEQYRIFNFFLTWKEFTTVFGVDNCAVWIQGKAKWEMQRKLECREGKWQWLKKWECTRWCY